MKIDTAEIEDIEFEDVDPYDFPDFCDAYISEATYKGREMTHKELDILNEDYIDFVYEELWNYLYWESYTLDHPRARLKQTK